MEGCFWWGRLWPLTASESLATIVPGSALGWDDWVQPIYAVTRLSSHGVEHIAFTRSAGCCHLNVRSGILALTYRQLAIVASSLRLLRRPLTAPARFLLARHIYTVMPPKSQATLGYV
jgi:hypothetical protein